MAISYDLATNQITVAGYTLAVPCTFADLYNADKAGTLSLHARVGIAATDGGAVAVDRAERPTDYVVLGGASNDLYITVANWASMTTATIRITGTDRDGAAQTEDLVFVGAGSISTTKWFKTITHTEVTVFTTPGGGSFDYDLIQGQWGVVWKQNDVQFRLDCKLQIGDGGTATWFADAAKGALFYNVTTGNWQWAIRITNNAEVRLGVLGDATEKTTYNGCVLQLIGTYHSNFILPDAGSVLLLYSTLLLGNAIVGRQCQIRGIRVNHRIWNVISSGCRLGLISGGDLYNVCVQKTMYGYSDVTGGTFDKTSTTDVQWYAIAANAPVTISGLAAYNCIGIFTEWAGSGNARLTNCVTDLWHFNWGGGGGIIIYRQYTFNLRVVDATGAGINGATVSMSDRLGSNTFTVNTDAVGDIVEQTISYGYYTTATGDTIQPAGTYSPHAVTISKAGYATRTILYTMDQARVEVEMLLPEDRPSRVRRHGV